MRKISIFCLISTLFLFGCSSSQPISENLYLLDTIIDIRLYDGNEKNLHEIGDLFTKIDKLVDPYHSYDGINNVYTLNHTNDPIEVDPLLMEYLKGSFEIKEKTEGYIEPLILDLTSLWKDSLENQKVPDQEAITACLDDIKMSGVVFSEDKIQRLGNAKLDSGALAKGFAITKAKEYLEENNIHQYLISAGGSSIIVGEKPNNQSFKISLKEIGGYIEEKNTTISTSSIYQQQWIVDGKTYSHIINPFTGECMVNYPYAMAIGEDAFSLDGYSTMFLLRSKEDCQKYEKDCSILVFDGEKTIFQSKNIDVK